jgi:hypothetical protein
MPHSSVSKIRLLVEAFGREYFDMRHPIAIAALVVSALAASVLGAQAQTQNMGAANARAQQAARDAKDRPPKADEDAYKNALRAVPAPQNTDPWGSVRSGATSSNSGR